MRSFTSCQAVDMDRLFGFSFLLAYLSVIESTGKNSCTVSQPGEVLWKKIGDTVDLSCNVSSNCPGLRYEWFVFKEKEHLRLDVESNHPKYSLKGASLHINSLNINDRGIYHCAAVLKGKPAPGAQHIGMGTRLEVKEVLKTFLLGISFVMLSVYSLAIVTLIILKKYGCTICSGKRMRTPDKNNSIRKKQFHHVLQEMYSKRNEERDKPTVSRNSPRVEAAHADFTSSTDDIYQNTV
ncbi:immunoglobulin superfamily member 6 [Scomber japonicus]|uniref:immunoglobulin superfamily member 6 n=1 Tax=Scomber japonicus TaxID=13676 RepID=UPI00230573CA|nr:immunoglobulin superfamily member 6 [Scomber japonicus]